MADTMGRADVTIHEPKPSVGRIVHYHDIDEDQPVAAIITRVNEDSTVNLHVFYDLTHSEPVANVSMSENPPGPDATWSWPPRV